MCVVYLDSWATPQTKEVSFCSCQQMGSAVAIEEYPVPHNLRPYRKFEPDIAKVATRTDEERGTFPVVSKVSVCLIALKRLLISAPVLSFPDFTKSFILETELASERC